MMPAPPAFFGKEETLRQLKARYESIQKACRIGAEILQHLSPGIPEQLCHAFSNEVFELLSADLAQQIKFVESPPMPVHATQFASPAYGVTVEQLATAEMQVQAFESQIAQLEDAAEDVPDSMRAVMLCMLPMLKQQLHSAEQQRDYLQKALEHQQEKKADA